MQALNWELQVLSRAIAYNNLSGAAQHVGISQPQLSRIVRKIEDELQIQLLSRETKRKSTWTPAAHKLTEIYQRTARTWQSEVASLGVESHPTHFRVGTLEGLIPLSTQFVKGLYRIPTTQVVELDVHDLSSLEENFFRGHCDFIFTSREPGSRKHQYVHTLGYQTVESTQNTKLKGELKDLSVFSSFEWGMTHGSAKSQKKSQPHQTLVSNSLEVRRLWIQTIGGSGALPSDVYKKPQGSKSMPVILIGSDRLSKAFWSSVISSASLK